VIVGKDLLLLATLDAVLRTTLVTTFDPEGVKRTTDDVVANAGKVTDTSAANQNDRVFLKVVTFTTDVGTDFATVGETDSGDLTERRVRLLRSLSLHLETHTSTLRT
jgi:hypothetical protein